LKTGKIVAGNLQTKQARNEFLCTTREYENFELRFEYKRLGNNGGVQFRSQRIANHHEMIGFQADLAPGIDGCLYDESRRKKFMARPSADVVKQLNVTGNDWVQYRVRAEGNRIRLCDQRRVDGGLHRGRSEYSAFGCDRIADSQRGDGGALPERVFGGVAGFFVE